MKPKKPALRGSIRQNSVSARGRVREEEGMGLLARLGIAGGLIVALAILGVVGWHSGWPKRTVSFLGDKMIGLTADAKFEVRDIIVEGRRQSSKEEISDALGIKGGTPILSIDLDDAAKKVGKLPWISSAIVERRLPDTIAVFITERVPLARWQRGQKTSVIDTQGRVLSVAKIETFTSLPLVVGAGADKEAKALLGLLSIYPEIREKTLSAVRVSNRRWDLHLTTKTIVKLPENEINNALHRLSVLISEEKILERSIATIDLRLSDRLILEPVEQQTLVDKKS